MDRLVKDDILEPVDYSRFGAPIVPVLKKGGGVRLYGDYYKVTINQFLKIDQHPLPTTMSLGESKVKGVQRSAAFGLETNDVFGRQSREAL